MVNNIKVLRNFRNYFIELKNSGVANRFELEILEKIFPLIQADNSFFKDTEKHRDQLNLLHLMKQVHDKLNGPDRGKVIELYIDLFT